MTNTVQQEEQANPYNAKKDYHVEDKPFTPANQLYFEEPSENSLQQAGEGKTVVIQDWDNNEFRALIRLTAYPDRYVYVSRRVDGEILNLLDDTKETVALYRQGESEPHRQQAQNGGISGGIDWHRIILSRGHCRESFVAPHLSIGTHRRTPRGPWAELD